MVADAVTADAAHLLAGGAGVAVALAAVYLTDRPAGGWTRPLRSRLLCGVPWGTLLVACGVTAVYLFVQSGIDDPSRPVVIPFRSWSYFSPEGMLWSSFAHSGRGHLTGNLLSALVAGGLAEYAYGHFPAGRELDPDDRLAVRLRRAVTRARSDTVGSLPGTAAGVGRAAVATAARTVRTLPARASAVESPRRNPYVRALLVVPGAAVLFGLGSALFALGPVVGFSGVVFAYWGFALVSLPVATLVGLTGTTLAGVVYQALRAPVAVAEASPSYGAPGWANVAVQGHALGVVAGALAAVLLLRHRARTRGPGSGRPAVVVFGAVLLFGASRRLWAAYWYLGNERYELYRAVGVGLIALLAAVVAVAASGRDEPLWPARAVPEPETLREAVRSATPAAVGVLLLVASLAAVAGPGVIPNLTTVEDGDLPNDPIEVEGYQLTYAEGVEDRLVSVVDVTAFGRSTSVTTSGVIVSHPDREIWTTAVSRGNLAFWGYRAVDVGGTGWRETVWVQRVGWVAADGGPTYRVDAVRNGTRRTLFTSEPARADPRIDGRTVAVAAVETGFEIRVKDGDATATAPLPAENESVTLRGVTVVREPADRAGTAGGAGGTADALYAERGETRVRVAERERYEGRQR